MHAAASVLATICLVFIIFLVFRLVMEWVFLMARSYRPSGAVAVGLELTYSVTDPPLRALRRFIPPLRIGGASLDLSFVVLFIVVQVVRGQLLRLA